MTFLVFYSDRNDDEMYDYCSSDDCCLDVVCHDDGEESVRWKAPECILKKSYSTASDVWAFGVLMYEVSTYGCRPYRNIQSDKDVAKHVNALICVKDEKSSPIK